LKEKQQNLNKHRNEIKMLQIATPLIRLFHFAQFTFPHPSHMSYQFPSCTMYSKPSIKKNKEVNE
jgi:hypothetical protein